VDEGSLPLGVAQIVGTDIFKLYLPEYGLIQAVADGRASVTVQKEAKSLSNTLFYRLIESRRSFVWDSSMTDKTESKKFIESARAQNYELQMVAVLTEYRDALRMSMSRAREIKRFPNLEHLPKSHIAFRESLMEYVGLFDQVKVR
jgi:hypothetical protein